MFNLINSFLKIVHAVVDNSILIFMPPKKKKITSPQELQNKTQPPLSTQNPSNEPRLHIQKDISKEQSNIIRKSSADRNDTKSKSKEKQSSKKNLSFYEKCLTQSTFKLQGQTQHKDTSEQKQPSRKRLLDLTTAQAQLSHPKKKFNSGKWQYNQIISQTTEEDPKVLEERRRKFCAPEQQSTGPAIYQEPLPVRKDSRTRKFHKDKQQNTRSTHIQYQRHQRVKESEIQRNKQKQKRYSHQKQRTQKQKRISRQKQRRSPRSKQKRALRQKSPQQKSGAKSKHSRKHKSSYQGHRRQYSREQSRSNRPHHRSHSRHRHRH